MIGYLCITNIQQFKDELSSAYLPTFFMAVVTFTVGGLFMSIYGMACDTILQCYLVDVEVNKGQASSCPKTM